MRLFETILEANQRDKRGEGDVFPIEEFRDSLPVAALTCIDARLNKLVPEVLGVPEDKLVWLRNAGNVITGPLSSTTRSLALACSIKSAQEIAIIGHSDCQVCKTSMLELTDRFRALGILRDKLPENLVEYFGLFASERQNVMKGAEIVRSSPLIGPKVPVHGLVLDLANGRLEWVVNGYQGLEQVRTAAPVVTATQDAMQKIGDAVEAMQNVVSEVKDLKLGEMKFPNARIGELASEAGDWLKKWGIAEQGSQSGKSAETSAPQAKDQSPTPPPVTLMEMARRLDPAKRFKVIGRDQKMYGPVTVAELLSWLSDNRVDHTTPAQREDSSVWKPLGMWLKDEISSKVKSRWSRRG